MVKSGQKSPKRRRDGGNGVVKVTASSVMVPEDFRPTVREACGEVIKFQAAGMNIREQYLKREASVLAQIRAATHRRDVLIRKVRDGLGVPDDWTLVVETMGFRPTGMPPVALQRRASEDTPEEPEAPQTPTEDE